MRSALSKMRKIISKLSILTGLLIIFIIVAGCSSGVAQNSTPIPSNAALTSAPPAAKTEFARMLGYIPYSFLEEHDIWFSNPQKAKQLHGMTDANSSRAVMSLTNEEKKQLGEALSGIAASEHRYLSDLAEYYGYDEWMADRQVFPSVGPPWTFLFNEGDFDEALIESKLSELGYQKTDYGNQVYYLKNDDFQIDLNGRIEKMGILSAMNRVAVLDDVTISAPSTAIMTGILDAKADNEKSLMDDTAIQALTDSLGEVLCGVIIRPERVADPAPGHSIDFPLFDFQVPENWGTLHEFEMVANGYKEDGSDRTWLISLYYKDFESAKSDSDLLVTRMKSYVFGTQFTHIQNPGRTAQLAALTDRFDIGQPMVETYKEGATLTISCKFKTDISSDVWLYSTNLARDLLFLAPDPTPYIKK